ncbi:hypothetical protein [Actinomadura sp. 9N407]|uniref:hypothetical protein n=1 Tax=Actinomadura sp. 9N407 TaxID=3375154 RepID=UPI00378F62CA
MTEPEMPEPEMKEHSVKEHGVKEHSMNVTSEGVRNAHVVVPMPDKPGIARLSFDNGVARLGLTARDGLGNLLEADFDDPLPTVWSVDGKTHVEYPLGSRLLRRPSPSGMRLDSGVPWSVDVHGGAAHVDADFTGVDLRSLAFHAGVAHVSITLGRPSGTRTVRFASADDLRITRPEGVPVRIEAAKGLTKVAVDDRSFGAVGNGLIDQTSGYGTAEDRYLVIISGGVSGLTLS